MDWAGLHWVGHGVWVIIDTLCLDFFYLDLVIEIRNPRPALIYIYNRKGWRSNGGIQTHDLSQKVDMTKPVGLA